MLQRMPFKFSWLNVVVIGAFVLFIVVASSGNTTLLAQGGSRDSVGPAATLTPTPLPQSGSSVAPSSESTVAVLNVEPSAPFQVPLALQASWPNNWYTVVGSVFLPANSGYSYQYGNSGCIKSNSPGYWRASVNLPDGSVAKYLYINYYNGMYSANSTAWLTRYKYDGDYQDLVAVNSRNYTTTNVGYFLDLSEEFTETIDNLQYGYVFIWGGSITQRLCSVRLGYYPPPLFGIALPLLLKQS